MKTNVIDIYLQALNVPAYYEYDQPTSMSQTECPESQVRCRMRNTAQAELNCVYSLMYEHLTGNKLLHQTEAGW